MKGHGTVTVNHDFVAFSADEDRVVNFASMCKLVGLAEITVDLSGLSTALGPNTQFNLEIKPPKGAVLNLNRTTPAAIQPVLDLS